MLKVLKILCIICAILLVFKCNKDFSPLPMDSFMPETGNANKYKVTLVDTYGNTYDDLFKLEIGGIKIFNKINYYELSYVTDNDTIPFYYMRFEDQILYVYEW